MTLRGRGRRKDYSPNIDTKKKIVLRQKGFFVSMNSCLLVVIKDLGCKALAIGDF